MKKIFFLSMITGLLLFPAMAQNNALYMDGTGDYLAIEDDALWAFGYDEFTISFWMTLADLNNVHDGLFARNDFQWLAMEYNHDGDHRLTLWIDSNGSSGWNLNNLKPSKNDWVANTWYHIAVIRNDNTIRIYIDGAEAISASYTQQVYNPTGVPVYFGRSQLSNRHHHGQMDEMRIWNYGLSQLELNASMYTELSGNEPGLIGYWNCNESAGTIAYDATVNENDGTLNGDAVFVGSSLILYGEDTYLPYSPVDPTGLPYTIIISEMTLNDEPLPYTAQLGVFDGDLCVGAELYNNEINLQMVTWQGDESQELAGFTPGNPISFHVLMPWFSELQEFIPVMTFSQGSGDFGFGTFSVVSLNIVTDDYPHIQSSEDYLNFNAHPLNSSTTLELQISNSGSASLHVDQLSATSSVFTVTPTSFNLDSGEMQIVEITFIPTAIVEYEEFLNISSDDPDYAMLQIPLYGSGLPLAEPDISITPGALNFGTSPVGSATQLDFNIYNGGTAVLQVTSITSSTPEFVIIGTTTADIPPGDNYDVTVEFTPSATGVYFSDIIVYNNDQTVHVNAIGNGSEGYFNPVDPTGLPYTILVDNVNIQGFGIYPGDEIAAFDGELCVGAGNIYGDLVGRSMVLDGNGDYVNLGNPEALHITGSQTIEMWVKPVNFSARRNPYAKAYGGEGTITIETNGTLSYFYGTNGGDGSPYQGFTTTTALTANQWNHMAIVRDLENMQLRWYINGNLVNQTGASYAQAAAGSNTAYIGRGYVSDFAGKMDEVRIWNVARSQGEIVGNMNSTLSGVENGLAGYWNFDMGSASDGSPNGLYGTIYGNTYFSTDAVVQVSGNIQLVAWQGDPDYGLAGFIPGDPISFKIWTTIYDTQVEIDADAEFIQGDGTFGNGPYSVVNLSGDSGLEPDIELQYDNLYVGQLEVNQSVENSLRIFNNGNAPLQVSLVENSSQFSIDTNNALIPAAGFIDVGVTFSPTSPGNHTAVLEIMSNDPDTPTLTVALEGFALPIGAADGELSTGLLTFGGVVLGETETRSFNVINIGTAPLNVNNITSTDAHFTISPTSFTLQNTNDNQEVFVTFLPTGKGLLQTSITVTSNALPLYLSANGMGYEGHFVSVEPTGLPYSIVVNTTNLSDYLQFGDEIAVFDGDLCVGTTPVQPVTGYASLMLDGSGDYVEVADDPSLDLPGNQMSVEAWVYVDAYAGDLRDIIGKIGWSDTGSWSYNFHIYDNGALHFNFSNTSGTTFPLNSPVAVGIDAWHHVAATYDGVVERMYIDGIEVASQAANGDIRQNNYPVRIGSWYSSDTNYFNGMIDELRLWNTARSQDDIQANMFEELSGQESGLAAYWKFNSDLDDSSPNNNVGTLYGNANVFGEQSIDLGANYQVIAWQADPSQGLEGFTPGNEMNFKVWTYLNAFGSELNTVPEYVLGDGSFGYGQYSVVDLDILVPGITVNPEAFFFALEEPNYTEDILEITNTGDEDLEYEIVLPALDGVFHVSYHYSPGTGAGPPIGPMIWEGEDQFIDSNWGGGGPGNGVGNDDFQVIWTGEIFADVPGIYNFHSVSDDGIRLYIDDTLVFGSWADHGSYNGYGSMDLTVGYHDLVFEYYENGGSANCYLYWTPPGESETLLPAADLIRFIEIDSDAGILGPLETAVINMTISSEGLLDGLYDREMIVYSNAPDHSPINIPVQLNVTGNSQIFTDSDILDFGELIVGQSNTLNYLLENIGTDDLIVEEILISGGDFTSQHLLNDRITLPFILYPLNSQELSVEFAPTIDGEQFETLTIVSDAANEDSLVINLTGNGITPPEIAVDPVDWSGLLPSGTVELDTITISNLGQAVLNFNLDSDIPWLSLEPSEGSVGIGQGIDIQLNISTIGVNAGVYNAQFSINSNDLLNPEIIFPLTLSVTGEPEISMADAVEFGIVPVGSPAESGLEIFNTGTDVLTLEGYELTGTAFYLEASREIDVFPFLIPPGESDILPIFFDPPSNIEYSEILTINSTAVNAPELTVVLHGRGYEPPDIELSEYSFSQELNEGDLATQTLTIYNEGLANLDFDISLDNPGGSALRLDGSGDYMNVINTVSLNPQNAMTIQAWINLTDNANEILIAKEQSSMGPYRLWINNSHQLVFELNGDRSLVSTSALATGIWMHIAATFNGTIMKIYLDGTLDAQTDFPPFTINTNAANLRIGRSYNDLFYNGLIDELTIWDLARNESEIQAMMHQSHTGSETGLILYYKFDETTGNIAVDSSVNGNDGTFYGNASRVLSGIPVNEFLSISENSGIILPGNSMDIDLDFTGAGFISNFYHQQLLISSNDPDESELIVPVLMTVLGQGEIAASSMSLDFSDTYIGITNALPLTIYNTGSEVLIIDQWNFDNTDYAVSIPFTEVSPLSNRNVNIYFAPTSEGPLPAALTILSNANNDPSFVINLSGTGVEPPIILLDPEMITLDLDYDSETSFPLNIANMGGSDLNYTIISESGLEPGLALELDGAGYGRVNNPAEYDLELMTYEFWVKPAVTETDAGTTLFERTNNTGNNILRLRAWAGATDELNQSGYQIFAGPISSGPIPYDFSTNQWSHIAVVVALSAVQVYINGIPVYTLYIDPLDYTYGDDLLLGKDDSGNFYSGSIDEIRIWSTARSITELNQNKNRQLAGDEPGLIGYFNFDGAMSRDQIVEDLSPNNNHLFLIDPFEIITSTAPIASDEGSGISWLTLALDEGVISPGDNSDVMIGFNSQGLSYGLYTTLLLISSNDIVNNPLMVDVNFFVNAPVISAQPNPLLFDPTSIESSRSEIITVTNTGNLDLVITDADFSSDDFSIADRFSEVIVAPDASAGIEIQFTPSVSGEINEEVAFTSNVGEFTVQLSGTGYIPQPEIEITNQNLNISGNEDEIINGSFTIQNTGEDTLTVHLSTDPDWISFNFTFLDVNPGESQIVEVTADLAEGDIIPGVYTPAIEIINNDLDENPTVLGMTITVGPDPDIYITDMVMDLVIGPSTIQSVQFNVGNNGPGTLGFTVSENVSWIINFTVTDTLNAGEETVIDFIINSNGLSGGDYTDTILISSNDEDLLMTINMEVQAPNIVLPDNQLYASAAPGNTAQTSLIVQNIGLAPLDIEVTSWLQVLGAGMNDNVHAVVGRLSSARVRSTDHNNNGSGTVNDAQINEGNLIFSQLTREPVMPSQYRLDAGSIRSAGSSGNDPAPETRDLDLLGWLSVDPETATIQPLEELELIFTFDAAELNPGVTYTTEIYITHNDTGQQPKPVGVEFYVLNIQDYFTSDDNQNNFSESLPDDDLDTDVCAEDTIAPIEFDIFVPDQIIESAQLAILAFDVDVNDGEINELYLNDQYIGSLTGASEFWSTSVYLVDPEFVVTGWNRVRIEVDVQDSGNCAHINWGQLIINGAGESTASFDQVLLDSDYGYMPGNSMTVSYLLSTTLVLQNILLETYILNPTGGIVSVFSQPGEISAYGYNVFNAVLDIPAEVVHGDYQVQSRILDTDTNLVQDQVFTDFPVGVPVLTVEPIDYNFGEVPIGDHAGISFEVTNTGDLLLILAGGGLEPPFSMGAVPEFLEPSASAFFDVFYDPVAGGVFQDGIIFASNAGDLTVPVSGSAEPGVIVIEETGFEQVLNYGETAMQELVVLNEGTGILNYDLSGANLPWLTVETVRAPIGPGDSVTLNLIFDANNPGGLYTTDLIFASNDLTNPVISIPVSLTILGAALVVSPDQLSQTVNAGDSAYSEIYLNNTGFGPLNWTLNESVTWLSLDVTGGTLPPSGSITVEVTFDGDIAPGTYTATIVLNTNDPASPQVIIPVTFHVWGATLVAIPGQLQFGNVVVDTTRTLDLTLLNNGNEDLTVTNMTSVDPFVVNFTSEFVLAVGASAVFQVSFTAGAAIFYNEQLSIETSAGEFIVNLSAVGAAPFPQWQFSWNHYDFGMVPIAIGETTDLTIWNTGNIAINVDDWDVSSEYFEVSETLFTIPVGGHQVIEVSCYPDAIAVFNGTLQWTSNDIGTAEFTVLGKGFHQSEPPVLTYLEANPFNGNSGVNPPIGPASTNFEYQVIYSDPDNNAPMAGYPRVGIDLNGDGDFLDPGEGERPMFPVNVHDYNYSDGKLYSVIIDPLPINMDHGYKFIAFDALGNPAIGEGANLLSGPEISNDLLDISIFANDINFSDLTPSVGQEITISATIHNNSDYPADAFVVSFFEEDDFIMDIEVPGLSQQSQTSVSIEHVFTIDEFYPIRVVIDSYEDLEEDNEFNNFAIRPVLVGEFSIPGAIAATANLNSSTIHPNNTLRFYGHAEYINSFDQNPNVSGAQVVLTIHETGASWTGYTNSIGDFDIYFGAPGALGQYTVSATVTDFTLLTTTPVLSFTVVDPYVPPSGGSGPVYDPVYGPDLHTHWWNFSWTSACRTVETPIEVTTSFANGGNMPAEDVLVYLMQDGVAIDSLQYLSIPAGTSVPVTFYVNYSTPGTHSVGLALDPHNTIEELHEHNNSAGISRYIYPLLPDLNPQEILFNDNSPILGQNINLTFRVKNNNCTDADESNAFIYHEHGGVQTLVDVLPLDPVDGLSSRYLFMYDFTMMHPGWNTFTIQVDPDEMVWESHEGNQFYSRSIYVTETHPELTISDISISNYNADPGDLINFTATVWNNGNQIADDFSVRFYYDDIFLSEVSNITLDYGTNLIVTSSAWVLPDCPHTIKATVNEDGSVFELNPFNNEVTRVIGLDFSPAFWPYYWYNTLTVQQGQVVTVHSRIRNYGTFGGDEIPVAYTLDGDPVGLDVVPYIPGNSFASSQVVIQFDEPGNYTLQAYADPIYPMDPIFCEISETNNTAYLSVHVIEQNPDLEILSQHISPTELNPDPYEEVYLFASFTNNGNVASGPFNVDFYVNSVHHCGPILVPNLGAHEDSTVTCDIPFIASEVGTHVVRVRLDENNQVYEYNEANNEASRAIIVGAAPDLTFSDAGGLWLSEMEPDLHEDIAVTAVVENNGGEAATAQLKFYYISESATGIDTTLFDMVQFTANPYDSLDVTTIWNVESRRGKIYAEITDSNPPEFDTFNNKTSLDYGPDILLIEPLPDLIVDEDTMGYVVANMFDVFENIDDSQLIYQAASPIPDIEFIVDEDYLLIMNLHNNWNGSTPVTVTAYNIWGGETSDEFILTVNPVNDPPVILAPGEDLRTVLMDHTLRIDVITQDPDGDDLILAASSDHSEVSAVMEDEELVITPQPGYLNPPGEFIVITVSASDAEYTDQVSFNLTINEVDPEPDWAFSWEQYDFGSVLVGETGYADLTIFNTGNVNLNVEDVDVTGVFSTDEPMPILVDVDGNYTFQIVFTPPNHLSVFHGSITLYSNAGDATLQLEGKGYVLSTPPVLTFLNRDAGVDPDLGSTDTYFTYSVVYTDADNNPPLMQFPKVRIDRNGDTDFDDPGEEGQLMNADDPGDVDYTDGKVYIYQTTLPADEILGYAFVAYDNLGNQAVGPATVYQYGPDVSDDLLDLVIYANDINFSNLNPDVGQVITMSATVHNNSDYPSGGFMVEFYEEDTFVEAVYVPGLVQRTQTTLFIEHAFPADGFYPMRVEVDAFNDVVEGNELNNSAIRPVVVGDFSVPGAIAITTNLSPGAVYPGGVLHFSGHANYVDSFDFNEDVSGAEVEVLINETGQVFTGYTYVNGDFHVYFHAPQGIGDYTVTAVVTDFTLTAESQVHGFTVLDPYSPPDPDDPVYDPVEGPDLVTGNGEINWSGDCLLINHPLEVQAFFRNSGNADAYNVLVHILADGVVIQEVTYPVVPPEIGFNVEFEVSFATIGNHSVSINVDPYNTVTELYEWNNSGSRTRYIYPDLPDLTPTQIWMSDNSPLQEQQIDLTFEVRNLMCLPSSPSHIRVLDTYLGNPSLVDEINFAQIVGGTGINLFTYDYVFTGPGTHIITVEVDPDDIVAEFNETNQILSRTVQVANPTAELSIPILSLSDPSAMIGEQVTFTAGVYNTGTRAANDFYLHFYVDGVLLGEPYFIESLVIDEYIEIESSLWVREDCGHNLIAVVDEVNDVAELNELNNQRNLSLGVDILPDLNPWYGTGYHSTSVQVGTDVVLYSRIRNYGSFVARNVPVSYVLEGTDLIDVDMVPQVGNNGWAQSQSITRFDVPGQYAVYVFADSLFEDTQTICEINEANNIAVLHVNVFNALPDLEVLSHHIQPSELNPDFDEPITLITSFTNNGSIDSGPFNVRFYMDGVLHGDPIYVDNVAAFDEGSVESDLPWSSDELGPHIIRVKLDEELAVPEIYDDNNEASRAVIVGEAPDLMFSDAGGLFMSNPLPSEGEVISIKAVVENNGSVAADARLNLYLDELGYRSVIGWQLFHAEPMDSLDIFFDWLVSTPRAKLVAEIVNSDPPEYDILNNTFELDFGGEIEQNYPLEDVVIDEDTQEYFYDNFSNLFVNIDYTPLSYNAESSVDQIQPFVDYEGGLYINLEPDWNGVGFVTVTVSNNYGDERTDDFMVTVLPVDDAPYLVMPMPDAETFINTEQVLLVNRVEDHFDDVDEADDLSYVANALDYGLIALELVPADVLLSGPQSGNSSGQLQLNEEENLEDQGSGLSRMIDPDNTSLIAYPSPGFFGHIRIEVIATDVTGLWVKDTLDLMIQDFIYGCMDQFAENYNQEAMVDDGSCEYRISIPMVAGWNWFSINVEAEGMSVNNVLYSLGDAGHLVKDQFAMAEYLAGTGWFGPLAGISNTSMYKLHNYDDAVLEFVGRPVDPAATPILVQAGWNWVSYTPAMPLSVATAMTSIEVNGISIKNQFQYAQYVPEWDLWFGSLEVMFPFDGFILHMAETTVLTYPQGDPALMALINEAPDYMDVLTRSASNWQFAPQEYESTGFVTVQVQRADNEVSGSDLLVAFVDDECRGMAHPVYVDQLGAYLFPLMIHGGDEENTDLQFQYISGVDTSTELLTGELTFAADMEIGSPEEPFILLDSALANQLLLPTAYAFEQGYPNPFNPVITLDYAVRDAGPVSITVFDAVGRQVAVLVDEEKQQGNYSITWNAQLQSSGVYFLRMAAGDYSAIQKVMLVK